MYRHEVESRCRPGSPVATSLFVAMLRGLIASMTSRHRRTGLRPETEQVKHIKRFQQYLDIWEATVGKLGFLSQATAEGFWVTLASTLSLLTYVTKTLGFKYLMTTRLSQDSIENLFGILRKMSGCNDHPTPTQFLISVNCLSFYSLARSPTSGNISQGLLNTLLDPRRNSDPAELQNKLDNLLDVGYLNEAHEMIKACSALPEHGDMVASIKKQLSDNLLC
ncbi:hypothetical protein ISCGN_032128 [Ixodes scapularis]